MRALRAFAFAFAFACTAAPALAASITVSGVGQTWALDFNGIADVDGTATVLPGLTSRIAFTVTGIEYVPSVNRTILSMDLVVENTSDASIWRDAIVSGIGFNTDPNVTSLGSGVSGDFGYIVLNKTLPTSEGFLVEVCVSGKKNTCNSTGGDGMNVGEVGSASTQLAFLGNITDPITIDNFGVRYTHLASRSLRIHTAAAMGVPTQGTPPIPEPAAGLAFGLGALLVGAALRRKRD